MDALGLALAALAVAGAGQASADAAADAPPRRRCAVPATFHVLHNDRIGRLKLPEGHYRIRVLDDQALTCERASKLFARFLQDFDGELPGAWRLKVAEGDVHEARHGRRLQA